MISIKEKKSCSYCNKSKMYSSYHKDRRSKDGHRSYCKTCVSLIGKGILQRKGRVMPPVKKPRPIKIQVDENGCHICVSHKPNTFGYYDYHFHGKNYKMHRFIYEIKYGKITNGLIVRHKCDNRLCINPEHLELGTKKDNAWDCISRGRKPIGENTVMAKLTESDVIEIRRISPGMSYADLSKIYNVSRATIRDVALRNTWKHL